ncbi:MAG: glucose-6-phosphate isomerase [Gemmatimonadetes bacterium]|nr:MAG: glucose-6-phosphate isomerase [Gemmatimonadota bacterium]
MSHLGWIDAPRASLAQWDELTRFAARVRREGLTHVVVCGMGGSSLAPQVLAASFGAASLTALDSTDPAAVLAIERAGIGHTVFVISSKSGTTVETLAFYHYFAARARPEQFVAITEPGTALETLARERGFRGVFPHPVDVGGRYAALTVVGMLPAALIGVDGRALLERAQAVHRDRAGAMGARLAAAAQAGRDKLVLRPPPRVARLADWIEQLVAESTGKNGRGVVPVVDDPVSERRPDAEVFAEFSSDPLDLGAEFLQWQYATRELCERLGVDAFDQPDVEEAKRLARAELAGGDAGPAGAQHAAPLPTVTPEVLRRSARPGDYLAILAYLPPTADVTAKLQAVRAAWGRALGCATTLGFGPRYLHSTGQLHKGGPNTGLFLVLTVDDAADAAVPELGITFGRLKRAQARGDIRALLARGRRVAHVHLRRVEDVSRLVAEVSAPSR